MAFENPHPILLIPSHIVAGFLAHLDSMGQLGAVILSHRVFLDAFKDNLHTITTSIILKQIPENLLPFSIAASRSMGIDVTDHVAVQSLLTDLEETILNPQGLRSSLATLTPDQTVIMSKTYSATERLCECFVDEMVPQFNRICRIEHPKSLNQQERLRLGRAFLRFQLVCNLFCPAKGEPVINEEFRHRFFNMFSPWVNEQLTCVSLYLEIKVWHTLNDVDWSNFEYFWQKQEKICDLSPKETYYLQEFLCQPLPFLSEVCVSKSTTERTALFQPDRLDCRRRCYFPSAQIYYTTPRDTSVLGLDVEATATLGSYSITDLERLMKPVDGTQDNLISSPFKMWRFVNKGRTPSDSTCSTSVDPSLRQCGYVIWDTPELGYHQYQRWQQCFHLD
ncbi:hypothetical protein F5Y06DRAFT_302861 [Hypoxylon sp. FL0890]|nr:hypothetical protein F5Y06DRAFT_302861 [Hypoxylon sp. FL0890]